MNWFYKYLARQPYIVVLAISVLSITCLAISVMMKDLPDFSEPTLGFEARGTEIGHRLTAWKNLLRETGSSGKLVANPNQLQEEHDYTIQTQNQKKKPTKRKKGKQKLSYKKKISELKKFSNSEDLNLDHENLKEFDENIDERNSSFVTYTYGKNTSFVDDTNNEMIQLKKNTWKSLRNNYPPGQQTNAHVVIDGYFCESPSTDFSHFVVKRIDTNSTDSLFEINALLAMCQLEHQIQEVKGYKDYCQKELLTNNCCRPWSLPNYVALFSNKSSCFHIEQDDVIFLQNLLQNCFEYFHNFKLNEDCSRFKCRAPTECTRHNAVFNILYFLADMNFIKTNASEIHMKNAMIFVPVARSESVLPFFYKIEEK